MSYLIDLLLRSTLVSCCALLVLSLIPKPLNQHRVFVARGAILILLLLPFLVAVLPHFELAVLQPEVAVQSDAVAEQTQAPEIPWLLIAWITGTTIAAARYLFSLGILRSIRRKAAFEQQGTAFLTSICKRKAVDCRVIHIEIPCTFGFRSHTVLVPNGFEGWTAFERDAALRHEAAHIMRADCAWQWLANLACAIYWCHPLVWITAKVLRTESEVAADNWAIESGLVAADYAAALVEIARKNINRGLVRPLGATTLDHKLETRVVRILSVKRLGATSVLAMAVTGFALVTSMALGGLQLTARPSGSGGHASTVASGPNRAQARRGAGYVAKPVMFKSRRAHKASSHKKAKGSSKATYKISQSGGTGHNTITAQGGSAGHNTITAQGGRVSTGTFSRSGGAGGSGSTNSVAQGGGVSRSTFSSGGSGGSATAGTFSRSGGGGGSASAGPTAQGGVGGGSFSIAGGNGRSGGSVSAGPVAQGGAGGGSFSIAGGNGRSGGSVSTNSRAQRKGGVAAAGGSGGSASAGPRGGAGGSATGGAGGHGGGGSATTGAGGAGGSSTSGSAGSGGAGANG